MGRERTVLIWEAHHQMLTDELRQVEQRLAARERTSPPDEAQIAALRERARELRAKLQALGPSPRAKMG
ncbi:MAG TPA: hypothetical protein VH540_18865 [Ktedonobacterales bacterium]|jgi:hypothetical protein